MNGVRSHAHAPTHAINLIRRAIIARHGFKYFTYGVRRAHALNTNHRHIARLEYKSKRKSEKNAYLFSKLVSKTSDVYTNLNMFTKLN